VPNNKEKAVKQPTHVEPMPSKPKSVAARNTKVTGAGTRVHGTAAIAQGTAIERATSYWRYAISPAGDRTKGLCEGQRVSFFNG